MIVDRVFWKKDFPAVQSHFARLAAKDLRLRFGRTVGNDDVSEYIGRLVLNEQPCFVVHRGADISGFLDLGWDGAVFDLGITVDAAHRREGIATALLQRAVSVARLQGQKHVVLRAIHENYPVRGMARKLRLPAKDTALEFEAFLPIRPAS